MGRFKEILGQKTSLEGVDLTEVKRREAITLATVFTGGLIGAIASVSEGPGGFVISEATLTVLLFGGGMINFARLVAHQARLDEEGLQKGLSLARETFQDYGGRFT